MSSFTCTRLIKTSNNDGIVEHDKDETSPSQVSLNILGGIHLKGELTDQGYVILLKLVKK